VVFFSNAEDHSEPSSVTRIEKGDLGGLLDALSGTLARPHEQHLAVIDLVAAEATELEEDWRTLCQWDPMLPPDASPPSDDAGSALIKAVGEALGRPQPLGWGLDPGVEAVTEEYSRVTGSIDVVIGQLVCLREALRRRIIGKVPESELTETQARVQMVIDRVMGVAAAHAASRLRQEAYVDVLTGLPNRRALERDLRRELARAERYGRRFTLVMADVDGLKQVNDERGHQVGDEMLRRVSQVLLDVLRVSDSAYRLGGDEFALLLPETGNDAAVRILERARNASEARFSWGTACYPDDGATTCEAVSDLADRRLYDSKRTRSASTANPG
jgi:diguanylate cyclase (GGDEF)-like protein